MSHDLETGAQGINFSRTDETRHRESPLETGRPKAYDQGQGARAPQQTQPGGEPDWSQYPNAAYLAYILKEVELIRARTDRTNRNTMIIVALLSIGIMVLIIAWLDLTGALPFF